MSDFNPLMPQMKDESHMTRSYHALIICQLQSNYSGDVHKRTEVSVVILQQSGVCCTNF